jgi:hypothetical protein
MAAGDQLTFSIEHHRFDLGLFEWRMFLSANRYPLRRNMR